MHFKKLYFLGFLFAVLNGFSQAGNENDVADIIKISVVAPAISYEKKIGRLQTLQVQAFMNINFGVGYSSSLGNTSFFYADPAAGLQYRYYYNGTRRAVRGKRTAMNSMNYIAPAYSMALSTWSVSKDYYGEEKRRPMHNIAMLWGLQRNFGKRFSLDVNAGPGIVIASTTLYNDTGQGIGKKTASAFELYSQIRIGFWINPHTP